MEWFTETMNAFNADVAAGPQWVFVWVNFMAMVFALAIPFSFIRIEARWALLSMLLAIPAMMILYSQVGYVRLLGLVHVVLWTPLAIYLWQRRKHWQAKQTIAGKWIVLLFATILISLAFDYSDVIRYILGDRA